MGTERPVGGTVLSGASGGAPSRRRVWQGVLLLFGPFGGGGKFLKRERECREFGVFYYCRVVVE